MQPGKTVHFARLVLIPGAEADGRPSPACLLFETTYDGERSAHVAELFALAGAELGEVFRECEGVSAGAGFEAFEATVRRGSRRPRAFAAPNGELGVTEIRHDAMLRDSVVELLQRERPTLAGRPPLDLLVAVRRSLGLGSAGSEPRTAAVREPGEPLLVLARFVPLVLRMLLHDVRERVLGLWHDRPEPLRGSAGPGAAAPAGSGPQRAFTHVALVKPGRFRRTALRRALALLGSVLAGGVVARAAPGVHALRFVLLDDGRLLFTNQQDGSLVSRLAALGRRARALLALVWSSTEGFPRALLGHLLGRADDDRLLDWLRTRELSSGLVYSAYPSLTTRDVAVNAELRALLSAEPTDARARRLLELV
jgi:hypothetical protein